MGWEWPKINTKKHHKNNNTITIKKTLQTQQFKIKSQE